MLSPASAKHNATRLAAARAYEPNPNGPLGEAPEWMSDSEKQAWYELVSITPDGVLMKADRWVMEIGARLMAKAREPGDCAGIGRLSVAGLAQLAIIVGKLGLTPADRARVSAVKAEKKNAFANLDEEDGDSAVQ